MFPLDLSYPNILKIVGVHQVKERSESRAFLAWFLENYYRLEESELHDCICDGDSDRGIDGIYVNDHFGQIDIFQARLVQKKRTIGDSGVRDFVGTLSQLRNANAVRQLEKNTENPELASLLRECDIAKKVNDGYQVRGIFITNAKRDKNAIAYLTSHPQVILYDEPELQQAFVPIGKTQPITKPVSFDISTVPHLEWAIGKDLNMALVPLSAAQLLTMEGIANGELFAWNVRQWLGKKTGVNRDIEQSIRSQSEHKYFPAFHNGLTVLCKKLTVTDNRITISGYAVVNGCQSLNALHANKGSISPDLRVLTKFVSVAADSPLAAKITDHTK